MAGSLLNTGSSSTPGFRTNPFSSWSSTAPLPLPLSIFHFSVSREEKQKDEPQHIMQAPAPRLCLWIPSASKVNISLPFLLTKMQQFFLQGLRGNEKEEKYCFTMRPEVWESYRDRYFCLFQKSTLHSCHAKIIPALFNLWYTTPKPSRAYCPLLNSLLK